MRYFWALMAYVAAIVIAVASCGKGTGSSGFSTQAGGTGGLASSGSGQGGSSAGGSPGGNNGGSTSTGLIIPDASPDGPCSSAVTCASNGYTCGFPSDGCSGTLSCGTCATGTICGPNYTCINPCTPTTCTALGDDCGMQGDGCGGVIDCGTCAAPEMCTGAPSKCTEPPDAMGCVPKTCAQIGNVCGPQSDGCNNLITCITCTAPQTCGGGGTQGECGQACVPKTCAQVGANCGQAADGCGGLTASCGTCPATQVCTGLPPTCGVAAPSCTGLCLQQVTCTGTATTSITGTVYAPNGTDPLYNTLVYVPNAPVKPFAPGVSCDSCGSTVSGSPLVSTFTGVDGTFTLTNMPVGANIPLVIQNGRWRRQVTIPNVASCVNTQVPATLTNMPNCETGNTATSCANKAKGDIPRMAFATGSVDALECVFRKIGLDDSEFANPGTKGRVQLFRGVGSAGAQISAATPDESTLWGTQAEINAYDMVLFPCQGFEYDKSPLNQQIVINYANAGGRIYATHYSYVWLFDDAWSTTAAWDVNQGTSFSADPENGTVNQTFPKGLALAQWLKLLYPASTQGTIQLQALRGDFDAVFSPPSTLWISITDSFYTNKPMHYSFNTPVGAPPANQCGRVLYDDFHVEDAFTAGLNFPSECSTSPMTPQEKMLEFMLFDLGSCVTPDVPMCTPTTCAAQNISCGPAGDGCGNIIQCGMCPSGQTCGGGGVPSKCGTPPCTPITCAAQSILCGPAGDGCGNVIQCGTCASGETCGGGTTPGKCGTGTCVPTTCVSQMIGCGPTGDGCGNVIQCGSCPAGQTCGGGGTPGQCGAPPCVPKTCATYGFNCGSTNDGCGNIINCGTCTSPQLCGGGGKSNVCGGGAGG